jgi:hypothetical protein
MAVEYFKWRLVEGGMETCVVPELGEAEPFQPLSGAGVDEASEECIQTLVDALRLPVGLRVVGRAHAEFGVG